MSRRTLAGGHPDADAETPSITRLEGSRWRGRIEAEHGRPERAKLREHRPKRESMLNAVIRVKLSGDCHRIGGAAALRLTGLFVAGLRDADVLDDPGQDLLGVVAQLGLRHIRTRRHQRLGEDGEFADDFFVVVADERA